MTEEQKQKLKILGERLRSLRMQRGLTLKEMGYKIEKEPQSISRLEMGRINPTYLYLLDICIGLDVDIKDIVSNVEHNQ